MHREALVPGSMSEEEMSRLMDAYAGTLLGVCRLILNDDDLAQDIVQETFLKAWKHADFSRESEKSWLVRVAVNLCHDYHRSRWWRHVDHNTEIEKLPLAAPEKADQEILAVVQALPFREREAVVLHYWHGLSAQEIAQTLRISRASVFRHLQKAKQHLKLELEGGREE